MLSWFAFYKVFFGFIIALFFTLYLIPLIIKAAFRLNVLDIPDGQLKSHKAPTPYLGGLAIYIGFITALAMVLPFENRVFLFLLGSTLLLFVGLLDDIIIMSPAQKFFGQVIASFCFLKGGLYLKENFFHYIPNIGISLFWILSMINAFNLVDVMDGLSTILAICATASFLVFAIIFDLASVSILLSSFLGALVAFLWYNKPNAKIYLGDAGSLFIGGLISTIPFMIPWGSYNIYGYITPLIILFIPSLEIVSLIIIRSYKGIPFYKGSPDHFCIYLQKKGWSKSQILLYVVWLSSVLFVCAHLFLFNIIGINYLLISLLFILAAWCFLLYYKHKSPAKLSV